MIRMIKIKNKICGSRYEHVVLLINNKKYYLKINEEITIDIFDDKIEIIFIIYGRTGKKILLDSLDKDLNLELKSDFKITTLLILLTIFYFILGFYFSFVIFHNKVINQILVGILTFGLVIFSNMFFQVKAIKLVKRGVNQEVSEY